MKTYEIHAHLCPVFIRPLHGRCAVFLYNIRRKFQIALWCLIWGLFSFPFNGYPQNDLQQVWIKPLGDRISSVNFERLTAGHGRFLIPGSISIPDAAFGCTQCSSNGNAFFLVTDSNGGKIYSSCYPANTGDDFKIAAYGKDGSIWVIGDFGDSSGDFIDTTGKPLGVVKFDSLYNPLWSHFYGSRAENDIADFITTSDGGALILASTGYAGGDIPYVYGGPFTYSAYLCKLDSGGNIKWLKVLGGSGDQTGIRVKELEPNIYTVAINTSSVDYMLTGLNFDSLNSSPWLLKIDTGGYILSSRVAQNLGYFSCSDFSPLNNGDIIFAGGAEPLTDSEFCYPGLGEGDFALVVTDSVCKRQWCKMMGGSGNDNIAYITEINDSVIVLLGNSASTDGSLIRCSADGDLTYHGWLGLVNIYTQDLIWQVSFCSSQNVLPKGMVYDSAAQSLYVLMTGGADGDFASAAVPGTTYNTYLFKYHLITTTSINELSKISSSINLFPNPATYTCTLKMDLPDKMSSATIIDALCRQVMPLFSNQQLTTFDFNTSTLATGLYFVQVKDEHGEVGVLKLVKQ